MSLAQPKLLVAVATILILASAGVVVQGRRQPLGGGSQGQVTTPPLPTKTLPDPAAAAVLDLAANRALARKQLALIDEAWDLMQDLAVNHRIDIDSGTFGPWGRRRLEALRKAGAGKAEIVAALDKYVDDLKKMETIAKSWDNFSPARSSNTFLRIYEIQFLLMEAEIWLNEEKAH